MKSCEPQLLTGLLLLAACAPQSPYEPPRRAGSVCNIIEDFPRDPITLDGDPRDWTETRGCINDPADDSTPQFGHADIEKFCVVYAPGTPSSLFFLVRTATAIISNPTPRIRYHFDLYAENDTDNYGTLGLCVGWPAGGTAWEIAEGCRGQGGSGPQFVGVADNILEVQYDIPVTFPSQVKNVRISTVLDQDDYHMIDGTDPIRCE